jgi:hypothetical protein
MINPLSFKRYSSSNILCVSHIKDVDGCVCASIIRHVTKSHFKLVDYGMIKDFLREVGKQYGFIYFCDLGIDNSILKEFNRIREFAELTYIDHHPLDAGLFESLEKIGVTVVHNKLDCASVLTYNYFKSCLPREAGLLASYAAFTDRLEHGPIANELIHNYDRDFVLFESSILSFGWKEADTQLKRSIVKHLSNFSFNTG